MAFILRMPEIAANATHARLENWVVDEGVAVAAGDVLAEIETEKALVEFIADADGILYRHLAGPGDDVEVGLPIAVLSVAGEVDVDVAALLGTSPLRESAESSAPGATAEPVTATASAESKAPAGSGERSRESVPMRQFASPIVRKRVRELNLSLSEVDGTGPQGRVTLRDLEKHHIAALRDAVTASPAATTTAVSPTVTTATSSAGYVEIPHSPMRRAIARRLTESKTSVPHFYLSTRCRVDALLELRRQINLSSTRRISVTDLVVRAVAVAFVAVPDANVIWTEDTLRRFTDVDLSIAIATEAGLVSPVLRDAASQSLTELSESIAELAERSRSSRIRQHELEGGSFAVTNLGMYGTREFSAILNPPQSGILAIGASHEAPVVENGQLAVGTVMDCTLSVDHRAVDGALAATWLAEFTRLIENPVAMLV